MFALFIFPIDMRDFEQDSAHREMTDENIEEELKTIDNVSFMEIGSLLKY